jgi:DNA-binding NarL/FixJ family response regulator
MIQMVILSPIPALRAGLRALASGDPELNVAAVASSLAGMLDFPSEEGVMVLTSGALNPTGLDRLAAMDGWPVLLVGDDPEEALALLRSLPEGRNWGLLESSATPEALQAAVRALAEGLSTASAGLAALLLARIPASASSQNLNGVEDGLSPDPLTERETDVLRQAAEGLTNKQIALVLGISEHTVKFHISAIYAKLGVSNRAEAVRTGARWGWIPL